MPTRRQLPEEVQLLGVTVAVKLASRAELDRWGQKGAYAIWVVDERTIYVLKNLAWAKKVEHFLHELEHAFTDYKHWMRDELLKP